MTRQGTGRFLQGWVEETNSDALPGMIDPVTIQRAYAANVDALKVIDGVLATVASEVRGVLPSRARVGSAGTCRRS